MERRGTVRRKRSTKGYEMTGGSFYGLQDCNSRKSYAANFFKRIVMEHPNARLRSVLASASRTSTKTQILLKQFAPRTLIETASMHVYGSHQM